MTIFWTNSHMYFAYAHVQNNKTVVVQKHLMSKSLIHTYVQTSI